MIVIWLLIILTVTPEGDIRATPMGTSPNANECYALQKQALTQTRLLAATCLPISQELLTLLRTTNARFGAKEHR